MRAITSNQKRIQFEKPKRNNELQSDYPRD